MWTRIVHIDINLSHLNINRPLPSGLQASAGKSPCSLTVSPLMRWVLFFCCFQDSFSWAFSSLATCVCAALLDLFHLEFIDCLIFVHPYLSSNLGSFQALFLQITSPTFPFCLLSFWNSHNAYMVVLIVTHKFFRLSPLVFFFPSDSIISNDTSLYSAILFSTC